MRGKVIGIDFDGTIVTHQFPDIGEPVPGALAVMHELNARGARIILWTVRDVHYLDAACAYLESEGVKLWGVNKNPSFKSVSPKAHCDLFIDDLAFGVPLVQPPGCERPHVDWSAVADWFGLELPASVFEWEDRRCAEARAIDEAMDRALGGER